MNVLSSERTISRSMDVSGVSLGLSFTALSVSSFSASSLLPLMSFST